VHSANAAEVRETIQSKPRRTSSEVSQSQIEEDLQWLSSPHNYLIVINDPLYPPALLQLPDPPLALFAAGDVSLLNQPQIAIVGSRRPTPVGAKIVRQISSDLASLGITITSGMALGIDGLAHQAALDVGGNTVAVMGCGLDIIYPARNSCLHQSIVTGGLIVSEFPLGVTPSKYTFPMRNRIVSGLSLGVVIVEAARSSGTLITAGFASEQNREVMVVPGSSVSRQYDGSHELIKSGAALVTSSEDVLHCLAKPLRDSLDADSCEALILSKRQDSKPLNHPLLEYIGVESTSMDAIILGSGLTTAKVSSILIELELTGVIAVAQDGGYVNLS
jgi:DNA processing protein